MVKPWFNIILSWIQMVIYPEYMHTERKYFYFLKYFWSFNGFKKNTSVEVFHRGILFVIDNQVSRETPIWEKSDCQHWNTLTELARERYLMLTIGFWTNPTRWENKMQRMSAASELHFIFAPSWVCYPKLVKSLL